MLFKNIKIYGENGIFEHGFIRVDGESIAEVGECMNFPDDDEVLPLPENCFAIPGFIDVHIHGAGGADVMDASPDALTTMAECLPAEGTTGFLATTMTQKTEAIEKALRNAASWRQESRSGQAEMLGVHLEGPFLAPEKAGAQPREYLAKPNVDQFRTWQKAAEGSIRLVTMAPELDEKFRLLSKLTSEGIVVSIGHSGATYAKTAEAVKAGANHITHLYNGMTGLHHREPGVVGAALLFDELKAELIVDGIHVCPEMVRLTFRQKGPEGVVLITDSIRAKGMGDGRFELGGRMVSVENGEARLEGGSLAGSVLRMIDGVRNMVKYAGCTVGDVIQMASANPAKQLGVYDRKGSLAAGKDADLVILDEHFEIVMTLCKGRVAYRREGWNA
ncbi:MAG TPA: N-acetylglucosamine-6-phosphate deacetylase [Bacillales bacterium]|nr:N-acetylglucosamine-6-phosphate deacetylase [Bacillales bacterium]